MLIYIKADMGSIFQLLGDLRRNAKIIFRIDMIKKQLNILGPHQ